MSMELGPYTNFHELNQDWLLNEFNKVVNQWKDMQKNFDNLQDAFNDLKSYVQDYFKNLDVQEEINNKLDEMTSDGTLFNILGDYILNIWNTIYINVEYPPYGLKGLKTGEENSDANTLNLNALETYANDNNLALWFPKKKFFFSGTINKGKPNWFGNGCELAYTGNSNFIYLHATDVKYYNYMLFSDFIISGNKKGNGITLDNGARQIVFSNIFIKDFTNGFVTNGCGEIYLNRVFSYKCRYSFSLNTLADSWITECHGGSGVTRDTDISYSGGIGFLINSGNNITIDKCRPQVQMGGTGLQVNDVTNLKITNCIVDQNEHDGVLINSCKYVCIINTEFRDNGKSTGSDAFNGAGLVLLNSNNVQVISSQFRNTDGHNQVTGIKFSGVNNNVILKENVYTGLNTYSNVDSVTNINADNLNNYAFINKDYRVKPYENIIAVNAVLSSDITITLDDIPNNNTVLITRGKYSVSNNIAIKYNDVTVYELSVSRISTSVLLLIANNNAYLLGTFEAKQDYQPN